MLIHSFVGKEGQDEPRSGRSMAHELARYKGKGSDGVRLLGPVPTEVANVFASALEERQAEAVRLGVSAFSNWLSRPG